MALRLAGAVSWRRTSRVTRDLLVQAIPFASPRQEMEVTLPKACKRQRQHAHRGQGWGEWGMGASLAKT